MSGGLVAEHFVLWCCPATALQGIEADGVTFIRIASQDDAAAWVDSPARPPIAAIVVAADPADQMNYHPSHIMELLAASVVVAPRFLVVVTACDLAQRRLRPQQAFALEMHRMWTHSPPSAGRRVGKPVLIVEEAVSYFRSLGAQPGKPQNGHASKRKSLNGDHPTADVSGMTQLLMWDQIAARIAARLAGHVPLPPDSIPEQTRKLVEAMTFNRPRVPGECHLPPAAQSIFVALSMRRLDGPGLARVLNYRHDTVIRTIADASTEFFGVNSNGNDRNRHFQNINDLVEQHAMWLQDLNVRQGIVRGVEIR